MSSSANSGNDGRSNRQPAKRAFAAELEDASEIFQESEEDRAPKFAMLPTGERANRVLAIGTLTEARDIGDESEYWQARVVDPTGTFFVYAGQYQPEAIEALQDIDTPEFVAVVGKPRVWERDDGEAGDESGNQVTQITPESITVVDRTTRDRWVVETAEQTMARIDEFQTGGDNPDADRAHEAYGGNMNDYEQGAKRGLADVVGVEVEDVERGESDE